MARNFVGMLIILLLVPAEVAPAPAPEDPLCPARIRPGRSVGPVSIGMRARELQAAGFALSDREGGELPLLFVSLCRDRVVQVTLGSLLEKADCWSVEGVEAKPAGEGFDVFEAFDLKKCEVQILKSGDRLFYCRSGGLVVGVGRHRTASGTVQQRFDRLGVIRPGLRINHLPAECRGMRLDVIRGKQGRLACPVPEWCRQNEAFASVAPQTLCADARSRVR